MSVSSCDYFKKFPKKMLDAGLLLFYNVEFVMIIFRDHLYIMSANGLGGWVQKKVIFAGIQYCIYADMVSGWVWKSAKMCWRNIGMVTKLKLKFEPLQSKNQGTQKWHLQNNTSYNWRKQTFHGYHHIYFCLSLFSLLGIASNPSNVTLSSTSSPKNFCRWNIFAWMCRWFPYPTKICHQPCNCFKLFWYLGRNCYNIPAKETK